MKEIQINSVFQESLRLISCNQLKPKLSSGQDSISTKLLKEIVPFIITPLHYLINLSLETGFVPPELKLAKIVPVFKDGTSHEFTNYRPISLLRSKLFGKKMTHSGSYGRCRENSFEGKLHK